MTLFRKRLLLVIAALGALTLGMLVYLLDRNPQRVYLLRDISHSSLIASPLFGGVGAFLPTFVHVFAFILLSVAIFPTNYRGRLFICLGWLSLDAAAELVQHPSFAPYAIAALPEWFNRVPILDNTADYIRYGTFDQLDLLSIVLGVLAAWFSLMLVDRFKDATGSGLAIYRSRVSYGQLLAIGTSVILGLATIIGSGGGGGGSSPVGQNSEYATTLGATNITATEATLNGYALRAIGCDTYLWFQWSSNPDISQFEYETSHINVGTQHGTFWLNLKLTGLSPDTTYHYRMVSYWSSPCSRLSSGSTEVFTTSLYSNATLTGTWMSKLIAPNTITNSFKVDGNGKVIEDYDPNPGILPSPYDVQASGSFTVTLYRAPTVTVTGMLTSSATGSITALDGSLATGTLRKVMDIGACQGAWIGALAGPFSNSFTITVDSNGTITGGSGLIAPFTGKLFCESNDATGYLATGEPGALNRIKFLTGSVVTGPTLTISGDYEANGFGGTYTLAK